MVGLDGRTQCSLLESACIVVLNPALKITPRKLEETSLAVQSLR